MSVNDAGTNTATAATSPVQSLEKRIELKTKYKSILEACISQKFKLNEKNEKKNAFFENEDLVVRCGVRAMGARRGWIRLSMRRKISMRWVPPGPKSQ